MIKNKYTKTIDTVKISNEALNKALQNVRDNDRTRTVKHTPRRMWKVTAAAAVCMAAVIAVGGVFWSVDKVDSIVGEQLPEVQNSFVVLANSQKLTTDSEVTIGEFYDTHSYTIGYITENGGKPINSIRDYPDDPIEYFQVGLTLQIPIHCEGENIESVTYSVEKYVEECDNINQSKECFDMYLCADEAYEGIIDSNATKEFRKEKGLGAWFKAGTRFTCAYDSQPVGYETETNWEHFKHRTSKLELPIQFSCKNEKFPDITPREYMSFKAVGYDSNADKYKITLETIYNQVMKDAFVKYYDNLRIDITANFTNGTSQTKTVQLLCDDSKTESYVYEHNVIKGTLLED